MSRIGALRRLRRANEGKALSRVEAGSLADVARERRVRLLTRVDCHLCQDADQVLTRLAAELGFAYEVVDIDSDADPNLRAEYSDRVPVIFIDGKEHGYWRVEEARFRKAIAR
ncbi:MAG: glutaredoxin family protein [Jatrophihabitantaceae bacterium]